MTLGYKDLLARADAVVTSIEIDDALDAYHSDDTVFVDIRDPRELEREGMIPGAPSGLTRAAQCASVRPTDGKNTYVVLLRLTVP
ncbi:MAG: hypothetical protein QM658_16665 [Gordonia sp. (in: high G+C Gram-positive bacteria)]